MTCARTQLLKEFQARIEKDQQNGLVDVRATVAGGMDQTTLGLVAAMNNAMRLHELGRSQVTRIR